MDKGWECPKCGKCYAPWVSECKATHNAPFAPSPNTNPFYPWTQPGTTGAPYPRSPYVTYCAA